MERKSTKKAWIVVFKGSIFPLIIGAAIFVLFRIVYKKYGIERNAYLDKAFISLLILFITYWVFKITAALFNWYAVNIAAKTKTKLDDKFIPLFKRIAVMFIWVLGFIVLLDRLGININAFVAALGVGSLAIALAAQDTIANIICGFLIMVDRPFSIGDTIKLPTGEKAKVLDIGIRRSKFISEEKAIIIVPNLDLSKSKIVNYTYGENL
ncbi:MAG: mechanosensitive ion channel family protein [Candidatus Omnitrophica bacterium]|nr:mechanosensitive ion channel family protein [Candidatus Omnitrophota bacterium]